MADVLSFRPTADEESIIERTRRSLGSKSRTDAIRFLIAKGAESTGSLADDAVWQARAPPEFWFKKSLSSREIDRRLYGRRRQ